MVQKTTGQKLIPYVHTDGKKWDYYFVDDKTGIIQYERRLDGKRIKFSTHETNGVKAKIFANRELTARLGLKKSHVRSLVGEELDAFLSLKESENLKYDTMNNVRRAVKQIRPYWGNMLPTEITADSVKEWFLWWKKNNPEIEIENAFKYFKSFCRYLHSKAVGGQALLPAIPLMSNPDRKRIRQARKRKKERYFTPEEFNSVYYTAENADEALVVLIMYTMATRISETLALEFGTTIFIDEPNPIYKWFDGQNKANLDGYHFLHKSLISPLRELKKVRRLDGTNLLFPQKKDKQKPLVEQMIDWEAWRKRAGLGWHWTPHTFRHTCLTYVFADERNPQAIACKAYRISMQTAMETYIKTPPEALLKMRDSIEVKL